MANLINPAFDTPAKIRAALDEGFCLYNVLTHEWMFAYNELGSIIHDKASEAEIWSYINSGYQNDLGMYISEDHAGQQIVDSRLYLEQFPDPGVPGEPSITAEDLFEGMASEEGWFVANRDTIIATANVLKHGPSWKYRTIELEESDESWQPKILVDEDACLIPVLEPSDSRSDTLMLIDDERDEACDFRLAEKKLLCLAAAAAQPAGVSRRMERPVLTEADLAGLREIDPFVEGDLRRLVSENLYEMADNLRADPERYEIQNVTESVLGADYVERAAHYIRNNMTPALTAILMEGFSGYNLGEDLPAAMADAVFQNELAHARADLDWSNDSWIERAKECFPENIAAVIQDIGPDLAPASEYSFTAEPVEESRIRLTSAAGTHLLRPEVNWYATDPTNMALELQDAQTGEGFACITANFGADIGNGTIMPPYSAYIDTNNCPWAEKMLRESGLAEPHTRFGEPVTIQSGFCEYPLYDFAPSKLAEYGAGGMEEYEAQYKEAFAEARERMFGREVEPRTKTVDEIFAGAHEARLADEARRPPSTGSNELGAQKKDAR